MTATGERQLKQVLKPVHLWAIAVGLVISGEYFGWNLGWEKAGTVGFLIATLAVTVMYITFIFSYTELTAAIPHAGGAFAYAYRTMGPIWGLVAGYATLIDFLFATPAIGFALGSYIHFLYPAIPVLWAAVSFNVIFMIVNLIGVKESATFSLVVTLLAVTELLVFMGIVGPHFKPANFTANAMPLHWGGIFESLPYAVWLYLAIEGVAMVAEEVINPKKNISKGYILGMGTLILLALGVMVLTGGIGDWRKLSTLDHPLPEAIATVLGRGNSLTGLFTGIGLFGLIASVHGTILASSRQTYAMARAGFLPKFLSNVNSRFKTPHWAIIAGGVISFIAMCTGTTDAIIVISAMGAVLMYLISMVSVFKLRQKEPNLERPFVSPFYPWFPAVALTLTFVCFCAFIYYYQMLSLIFFAGMACIVLFFVLTGKHKIRIKDDVLLQSAEAILTD